MKKHFDAEMAFRRRAEMAELLELLDRIGAGGPIPRWWMGYALQHKMLGLGLLGAAIKPDTLTRMRPCAR